MRKKRHEKYLELQKKRVLCIYKKQWDLQISNICISAFQEPAVHTDKPLYTDFDSQRKDISPVVENFIHEKYIFYAQFSLSFLSIREKSLLSRNGMDMCVNFAQSQPKECCQTSPHLFSLSLASHGLLSLSMNARIWPSLIIFLWHLQVWAVERVVGGVVR